MPRVYKRKNFKQVDEKKVRTAILAYLKKESSLNEAARQQGITIRCNLELKHYLEKNTRRNIGENGKLSK